MTHVEGTAVGQLLVTSQNVGGWLVGTSASSGPADQYCSSAAERCNENMCSQRSVCRGLAMNMNFHDPHVCGRRLFDVTSGG